ncbi:hypothetical protein M8C21_017270 [Ambrosia artemisiifolia]|uniref:Pectinesterase catalytic domain-containing protein n=1 Tax=Ambrosia artemisiifolia TaxID=4212 RepID=A0AAD5BJS2_AMBAR|nr:hypothetical protein M8C21_017270 [Ambrosia artemisiifolia]
MNGYQDTLYAHSNRQYYRQGTIQGTIDFIFADASAVFQACKIIVRKPLENQVCTVTAQGRKNLTSKGALVLQGCTITAEPGYMATDPMPNPTLAAHGKSTQRTIIMQSFININIVPEGWLSWAGTFGLDTCYFGEFDNNGPGANTGRRVRWNGIKKISPQKAYGYTPGRYIQGDLWIKATGVPYDSGMMVS